MLYDYICKTCGTEQDSVYNKIAERHTNAPQCCGGGMVIQHKVAPYGYVDNMQEYRCPVTGEGVTTRTQRNEIMAREGLIDANDILNSDAHRKKQHDAVRREYKKNQEAEPKELRKQVDNWATKTLGL